jgi:PPOX class probable F420-dependent enzyme
MTATTAAAALPDRASAEVIVDLPESHTDLIDGPYWAALTTVMPNGSDGHQPQTTPVWCNREGNYVLTNTMQGFRKEKNMRANPKVALLVCDPRNPLRNIEVRGLVVEMTEVGAVEHDDALAELYLGKPGARFFGDAVPAGLALTYVPVKVTIAPTRVRVEEPFGTQESVRRSSNCPDRPEGRDRTPSTRSIVLSVPPNLPTPVQVPVTHEDLLLRPVYGVLSTIMPDGQPQSSLVWVDYDGTYLLLNTTLERQKCRNMRANPRVSLLVVDPDNTARWVEVRGRVAEIRTHGAIEHADRLTRRYTGKKHFYGDVYDADQRFYETRVVVKILPIKVSLDAIFK